MRAPRIWNRIALTAPSCTADFFFKLENDKIILILSFELPRGCQPGNSTANNRCINCLPIVWRYFKVLIRAKYVPKINTLTYYLALWKFARLT